MNCCSLSSRIVSLSFLTPSLSLLCEETTVSSMVLSRRGCSNERRECGSVWKKGIVIFGIDVYHMIEAKSISTCCLLWGLCHAVYVLNVARSFNAKTQVADHAIAQTIAPSMDTQFLASAPGPLEDGCVGDIERTLDHVQLCQQVLLLFASLRQGFKLAAMDGVQVLDVAQPVVNDTKLLLGQ